VATHTRHRCVPSGDGITALGIPPNQFDDLRARDAFSRRAICTRCPIRAGAERWSKSQRHDRATRSEDVLCSTQLFRSASTNLYATSVLNAGFAWSSSDGSSSLQSGWSSPSWGCSQHRISRFADDIAHRSWNELAQANAILIRNFMRTSKGRFTVSCPSPTRPPRDHRARGQISTAATKIPTARE